MTVMSTPPKGWLVMGTAPQDYVFAMDTTERHSGTRCAVVRAREDRPSGFATLMQELAPDDYRGHRVRLSGWVKTSNVEGRAWLWMRADGAARLGIAMDNMHKRPIKGTTDWTRYDLVLDIPAEAVGLSFGMCLDGPGAAWLDDVVLELVGDDVPTTTENSSGERPRQPENLNFES